jgi:ABC transporter
MPGVVVLASHDRAFLDEVCTDLIDLDPAMRYAARRLEEFEQSQVRKPPAPLRFHAPTLVAPSAAGMAVSLRGVDVSGRLHVERLDVGATDHLLLTGPNGVGKSTLLAVVAGVVPADGQVLRRPGLRIGYLPQDSVFDRLDQTAQQAYEACAGAERAERVSLRSLGLIAPRDAATPVSALPVADVDRAKDYYTSLGWRLDADFFHDAGGVFHHRGDTQRSPGLDPQRRNYASFASFADPDGNGWLLQEVTTR